MKRTYVHIKKGELYDPSGQRLRLEGVGLNGWLLPEGYMFKSHHEIDRPRRFYAWTKDLLGEEASNAFWKSFRASYITEADLKRIKDLGFNSVRIPFDYEVLFVPSKTEESLDIKKEGFQLLDRVLSWCETYQLYAILDLHAAPGGQTGANIDNSERDQPELFEAEVYRKQTIHLWETIAKRYRNHAWIAAYDLLNEPLPKWFERYNDRLIPLYRDIIRAIRAVDPEHLITLEGVHWATDFSVFEDALDPGIILQFHKYWSPFNRKALLPYIEKAQELKHPLFMGEGGEHYLLWYSGAFKMYRQLDISWNFWSYKKMATENSICSFREPPLWQQCLTRDSSLTKEAIKETFAALLTSIDFPATNFNMSVVNHLFQRDSFETLGLACDVARDADRTCVCVDETDREITPNFSLKTILGVNTPFPYLRMNAQQSYRYTFNLSVESYVEITIEHINLDDFSLAIDATPIDHTVQTDKRIVLERFLASGSHVLTLVSNTRSLLKRIGWIVVASTDHIEA